ncbi:uncharacterized protein LOC116616841 [Nematostella vectensis]|uniref:uncharacterized protein LOC116616841 n=1 Tax=Nematostella vectensis TaxID=45351 RepID=UPI0020776510|nr:uncharacterized protein LOC116616841 [Nematostella vectensis]
MGNGASGNSQTLDRSSNLKVRNTNLHPSIRKRLQNWLDNAPFTLDETQTQAIYKAATFVEINTPQLLITKGSDPVGVYIITCGEAEVVSLDPSSYHHSNQGPSNQGPSNQNSNPELNQVQSKEYVIRVFTEGECFGEVSVLYDIPCIANVRVPSQASLILLRAADVQGILTPPLEVPMLRLCSIRRYLDTAHLFEDQALSKMVALDVLREVPVLHGWEEAAIKDLIKAMKQEIIVLYPCGSAVYREGDPGHEMYVLVHGRVGLFAEGHQLAVFDSGDKRGFTFGEEGFFTDKEKRCTIKALTPCQIITLKKHHFYYILNQYPNEKVILQVYNEKWKENLSKRDQELYEKYGGALDLEMLRMTLRQSAFFKDCPPGFIYIIALSMLVREIQEEQAVLSHAQYKKGDTLFLLLQGEAIVTEDHDDLFLTVDVKQVFHKASSLPEKAWVKATELSIVAYFNTAVISEAKMA